MRFLLILLLPVVAVAQKNDPAALSRWEERAEKVTIITDNWGVPHIYGKSDADAVFGLMYVQARLNFYQVEENFLEMLGRLSEVHNEQYYYQDLQMKLVYDTVAAQEDYHKSEAWLKQLMDAAADGLNYFLYKHPEVKPRAIRYFKPWYFLLRTDGSIGATQLGGLSLSDLRELYPSKNIGTSISDKQPAWNFTPEPMGSNGFAVAPSKTANGHAILYINPHTTFYYRPEVHIVSEEGLNAYGAVTWSTFFIYQGFNEYCGWMHTSSYADVADAYEETISEEKGKKYYQYDARLMPVRTSDIRMRYKKNDKLHEEIFTKYTTIHGPVLGSRNGRWLSLKENNRSMKSLEQSWLRTKAKGFEEYKKIMDMRVNNSNNTVFADNKGNIAYWHGNFMPKRNKGYDYGRPLNGNSSATNWIGLHDLDETVHVYNPESGWIQNCNSTPFTSAGESSPDKNRYPEYMAPDGENFRGIFAARLLDKTEGITLDMMIDSIGYNRYLSAFEILQPELVKAYDELPSGHPFKKELSEAIEHVRNWNRIPDKNSIASTLAIEWGYRLLREAMPPAHPYRNTDAIGQMNSALRATSSTGKLDIFRLLLKDLENGFGTWKVEWGEMNRFQRPEDGRFNDNAPSLAVSLAAGTFGSLPSYATRKFSYTSRRYGLSGNSFVACVEFGEKLRAKSVITAGNGFDPSSPHYMDQALMFLEGKFRDVNFYKEDVLKNARQTYHPGRE